MGTSVLKHMLESAHTATPAAFRAALASPVVRDTLLEEAVLDNGRVHKAGRRLDLVMLHRDDHNGGKTTAGDPALEPALAGLSDHVAVTMCVTLRH